MKIVCVHKCMLAYYELFYNIALVGSTILLADLHHFLHLLHIEGSKVYNFC